MTRFGWQVVLGVFAVCLVIACAIAWIHARPKVPPAADTQQAPVTVDPSQLSIYTSGEFGFSFFYPSQATVIDAYSLGSSTLDMPWRLHATATGTPIVRLEDGAQSVNVGMSLDAKEIAVCLKPSPGEEPRGAFTEGSTTWQEFMFQKIGTDNETSVTSYRVLHDKACYAVEVSAPLTGSPSGTSYSIQDTITSFTFAN
jgi:hypothetical protein